MPANHAPTPSYLTNFSPLLSSLSPSPPYSRLCLNLERGSKRAPTMNRYIRGSRGIIDVVRGALSTNAILSNIFLKDAALFPLKRVFCLPFIL